MIRDRRLRQYWTAGSEGGVSDAAAAGVKTSQGDGRWRSSNGRSDAQAARTTLVLAAPAYDQTELPRLRQEVDGF